MKRADLHTHSIYSDGKYTPDEVCRRARFYGVEVISITDHDTMNGLAEKRAAAEKYAYGIGLSFQIIDDILDAGTEDGKTTFLTFYTVEEAKALAGELTETAINAIKDYEGSEFLIALAENLYSRKI